MQLAVADLFRAKWTDKIHDEWISNLLMNRQDIEPAALERTKAMMNTNVRDCLVTGYEQLISTIDGLPDPDDRHVVAAAYHCGAAAIVTYNLRDFPQEVLMRYRLEAIHPDDFVHYQIDLDTPKAIGAVHTVRQRLKKPRMDVESYLRIIETLAMPKTVARLRQFAAIL
jgi:predicted nucleic acid-binding protein